MPEPIAPTSNAFPQRLVVTSRVLEAEGVISLLLRPANGAPILPFVPGQAIRLTLVSASPCGSCTGCHGCPSAPPQARACTYSLSDAPNGESYRMTIKRTSTQDRFSCGAFAYDHWAVGTVLEASAPFGELVLPEPAPAEVVLVAAGIGITPFMSMLNHLAKIGALGSASGAPPITRVRLRYTVGSAPAHPFRDALTALSERYPGLDRRIWYSQTHRLTREALMESTPGIDAADRILVCGPPRFITDVLQWLVESGIDRTRVQIEGFGAESMGEAESAHLAEENTAPPTVGTSDTAAGKSNGVPQVVFARSRRSAPWDGADVSILELAERMGLEPDYQCRAGMCGACSVRLLTGTVRYTTTPQWAIAAGQALPCCAVPVTDVTLEL
jgi:ferredoxin-NADP reductase